MVPVLSHPSVGSLRCFRRGCVVWRRGLVCEASVSKGVGISLFDTGCYVFQGSIAEEFYFHPW